MTDRKQFETGFVLHLRWLLDDEGYEAHWKDGLRPVRTCCRKPSSAK